MGKLRKFKSAPEDGGHFYASSLGEWRVDTDLSALIKKMERGGMNFVVVWVPLPIEAHYEIEYYRPVVEGCRNISHHMLAD